MKIGVVVLARHDSSRLPGKILRTLRGRTVLSQIVARTARGAPGLPIVVATSSEPSDDRIEAYCRRAGIECFRGSLHDVAGRFHECARARGWDYAIRINGDNLFVDPDTLRAMVAIAETDQFDFVTNVPGRTFPYGMSVEIVRTSFYASALASFDDAAHREHVTSWLYENPARGTRYVYVNRVCPEAAGLRLAIDTEDDLLRAEAILSRASNRGIPLVALDLTTIQRLAADPPASPWRGAVGPLLIAEIGGNHEGDFGVAKKLTESALESGADCIKFQIYRGDRLVSPVESPQRNKHFKKFELAPEQHLHLADMCRRGGVQYLASVWNDEPFEWIDSHLSFYKVGSGDLTAWPLLRALATRGKPILLSTGLATMDEVLQTVSFLQRVNPVYRVPEALCILQCTSMYPIPDSDAHLRVMDALRRETGLSVGYSDHTEGMTALVTAAAMGADALEFHFTDSREGKTFRDHKVSLTAAEVRDLRQQIARVGALRGKDIKEPQASELAEGHEISFRRAAYVNRTVSAGETIQAQDVVALRPAHGTDARDYEALIGATATRDLQAYTALERGRDYRRDHEPA